MNELEIIRTQLAAERRHAAEVANTCATAHQTVATTGSSGVSDAALEEFRQACVDYLVWILTRFEERDQMLSDVFNSRLAAGDETLRSLNELLARPGRSREALLKLEAAVTGPAAGAGKSTASSTGRTPHAKPDTAQAQHWQEFIQFFNNAWVPRRDALDKLFERHSRVTDWRVVCAIDADSILDERQRHGLVKSRLPPGLSL